MRIDNSSNSIKFKISKQYQITIKIESIMHRNALYLVAKKHQFVSK